MSDLRKLPSVDELLRTPTAESFVFAYGRPLTVQALRYALEQARQQALQGGALAETEALLDACRAALQEWTTPTLLPVINASGVIVHTNLGRAPLSRAALLAVQEVVRGYSNLEFDLDSGKRGSRLEHAGKLLQRLTGAEAALVVNNNAAAVLLVLTALAKRRQVVISRTQLVEIGGGFRVPDVMKQSGAKLVEIGTTNRVHLPDYEAALQEPVALVMRAHRSNFQLLGFTSEPTLDEITRLSHSRGVPVVDDLGSGTLLDTAPFGLGHEPTVQESLAAGVDLVCFSGDKLLGGPQAGIILGKAGLVGKLKKHPLARAIRADKLCLAALSATLAHYLKDEALREIPVWRMISADLAGLKSRAEAWRAALGAGEIINGQSTVGGGSLPGETLPTWLLALEIRRAKEAMQALRRQHPPVIARVQDERIVLDPRTVLPEQEAALLEGLRRALNPFLEIKS